MAQQMLPIPHGTPRGAAAHKRRAEPACEECVRAVREYDRQRRNRPATAGPRPTTINPMKWADRAACRGSDVIFYDAFTDEQKAAATQVCASCPVRGECLEHAIENREWGIWGGTTEDERKSIRRSRARKRAS